MPRIEREEGVLIELNVSTSFWVTICGSFMNVGDLGVGVKAVYKADATFDFLMGLVGKL